MQWGYFLAFERLKKLEVLMTKSRKYYTLQSTRKSQRRQKIVLIQTKRAHLNLNSCD